MLKIKEIQKNRKKGLQFARECGTIGKVPKRPVSQTVKTSPSHGEDMGSIPVRVTMTEIRQIQGRSPIGTGMCTGTDTSFAADVARRKDFLD